MSDQTNNQTNVRDGEAAHEAVQGTWADMEEYEARNEEENEERSEQIIEQIESFDDMGLRDQLLRGIYGYGFEKPSVIQQKGIVPMSSGLDMIAQAQSGTGKTGCFTIGLLQQLDFSKNETQALILSPTRELAQQIADVISNIGSNCGVDVHCCVGGTDWRRDVEILKSGTQVVVGTPGRVYDMLQKKALNSYTIQHLILDEADEMLSKYGFQDKVYDILCELRKDIQICIFSATFTPETMSLTQKFMKDAVKIIVKKEELTLEGIRQYFVAVGQEEWKFETLCDLYNSISIGSCVIFCNTRKKVDWLTREMASRNFTVSSTHGSLSATERRQIMKDFRSGASRVLITTDLLARGVDVQTVSLVINYDLPFNTENYLHRIGRSGRHGRRGLAINFVRDRDVETLRNIEKYYDCHIEELPANIEELL